jgi:predicted nucleic acid-binding protein
MKNGTTELVIDNCAAVNLVDSDLSVEEILAQLRPVQLYMSVITRIEFLAKPNMSAEELAKRQSFLKWVKLASFTRIIQNETVEIRREKKLKIPDAAVAATAVKLGATVLTYDPHLLALEWPGYSVTDSI